MIIKKSICLEPWMNAYIKEISDEIGVGYSGTIKYIVSLFILCDKKNKSKFKNADDLFFSARKKIDK